MLLSIIFAFLAFLVAILLAWKAFARRRSADEPPTVSGLIPWMGVGLEFGKEPVAMLQKYRAQCKSDMICFYMAGKRLTALLNIDDLPLLFRNTKHLSFDEFTRDIMCDAFGVNRQHADLILSKHAEMHVVFRETLQGGVELDRLTAEFVSHWQRHLGKWLSDHANGAAQEVRLYEWMSKLLFGAGSDTIFGEGWNGSDNTVLDKFTSFDSIFPLLCRGIPMAVLRGQENRHNLVEAVGQNTERNSALMHRRHELYAINGVPEADILKMQMSMLWASQANTVPAAGWAIMHLLLDPHAMAAVRRQIDEVQQAKLTNVKEILDRLSVLDSCITETLRLYASVMTCRVALDSRHYAFHSKEGQENVLIRKGDTVFAFSQFFNHDPRRYSNPLHWQFDRFIDGSAPQPAILFGGGRSMCPGRFFASNEIKLATYLLLTTVDIRVQPNQTCPQAGVDRIGFGVAWPRGDIAVKISKLT